ncbi:MAG: LacI family DNA-binding transcriptional regulator [Opitutaceae bacterium]|nr:LacI family DNA-binding transcriptional regulator [Opitutaceae bacterium]
MKTPKPHPSLDTVAQHAGVSKMTASRALRNTGRVNSDTRKRVLAAAEALGYRPNPLVQTLMAGVRSQRIEQSANIAWVTTFPEGVTSPPPVQAMEEAARERCREQGYELDRIHINTPGLTLQSIPRIFAARGIRAAIIGPMQYPGEIPNFPFDEFAVATIGRSLNRPALHYTMAHHFHAMIRTLAELAGRGYQRIGFLQSSEMDTRAEHSTLMAFEHHCLKNRVNPLTACQFYDEWKASDYQVWFKMFQPDVIIVDNSLISGQLADAGIAVGNKVGIATLSWKESSSDCAGIRQPFAALGAGAVDMVVAQLHRNERGIPARPKAMLFEGDWIDGDSLRPRDRRQAEV